jgi:dipeptidyl aminopeptidase/acylaminoacyl peptidase
MSASINLFVFLVLSLTALRPACAAINPEPPPLDLGAIPDRKPAPEFPFERFAQMRQLRQLQFSADDRLVYFLTNDGRVNNVFALDPETRELRQVTRFDDAVTLFRVDHGGRFLIVVKDYQGDEHYELYRFDLASGETLQLTDAGPDDTTMLCGISPDDSRAYFAQTRDHRKEAGIWEVDSGGGTPRLLVPPDGHTFECDEVSPDGRFLVYGELIGFDTRHLNLLDLSTRKTRTIMAVPGINNLDGSFSGDDVYFRSALGSDGFRLWRYRIDGGRPAPVTLPFHNDLESLSMYTGGRVAVVRYRDGLSGRTAVFLDGFDTPRRFDLPAESITGAVFSHDDPCTGILSTETATTPRRYYFVRSGQPRLVYDTNRSGIDETQLAEARSLLLPSFDGLKIPVHFFIPNGTSARRPRPAILLIHGGPEDHVDPLYDGDIQFLANRGFIVVTPNVRGSTGFGAHFAALDDGDWGGAHIRDIVAVADAVRTLDFVDDDNLFIAGESFGGFSVMSLLTRYPRTFRAAADFFGFTELATLVASWPRFMQRNQASALGFDPRIDGRRNRARSPIYHVDRIRIPVQIHQGANDARVPRTQSDWLVERLRGLDREVEYFVYPDEGHGFTRLANEALAYERLVDFFRRNTR